jgi:hypothetical protein
VKAANLVLRFACEVAAIVGLVWWGWIWLGVLLGASFVAVWGAWIAPRAKRRLPDPMRLVLELVLFAVAAAAYAAAGNTAIAAVFAVCAVVTAALVRIWPEPIS